MAVRVSGLEDLARLAASTAARLVVMPVYRFRENGRVYYMVHLSFKDYYKQYGIPLIYYYSRPEGEDVPDEQAKYILVKADETGERVEVTSKTRHGHVVIPIIKLARRPPFVPEGLD